MRLSPDQMSALKSATPLADFVGKRVKLGRASAHGVRAGACLCQPAKGKAPLWVNTSKQTWGCLKGDCGGDVIDYLRQVEGLDFAAAMRQLGGANVALDSDALARAEADRERRRREYAQREGAQTTAERDAAASMWRTAKPAPGSLVDLYFTHRGLAPLASPALRFLPESPYFFLPDDADAPPVLVHSGPCMMAAITGPTGRFLGAHRTWLDPRLASGALPRDASGKADIRAPGGEPLPAKKIRGRKSGGAIRLAEPTPGEGRVVLLLGEGVETTLTALQACRAHGAPGTRFAAWAACDLTNLSGAGLGPSRPHPARPGRWIPSDEPDPKAPGVLPPAWADIVVLLGDGDSDLHVTAARLECARRRHVASGTRAVIAMAPAGSDFNDLARRVAT